MKERGILFSAPMVRALLAGTKTQTRRVVKPQPLGGAPTLLAHLLPHGHYRWATDEPDEEYVWKCPYGQLGDRLWVRETFCDEWADIEGVYYRADGGLHADMVHAGCKWRPSIFMPRAASRITLEVTGVRVERLQDISDADAIAEGIERLQPHPTAGIRWRHYGTKALYLEGYSAAWEFARNSYGSLWESINGAGSWDANPWVWVVEFRRLSATSGPSLEQKEAA